MMKNIRCPILALAFFVVASAAMGQDARVCRESRNVQVALTACDAALADTHDSDEVKGELLFYRGLRRAFFGQNAGAIDDFTQAIAWAPSAFLYAAYTNRAVAYKEKRNYVSALADLTKALEIKPNAVVDLIDRAIIETDLGQFSAAAADSDKAIALDPNGEAPREVGCTSRALSGNDLDMALTDCNKALAIRPVFFSVQINRGLIYWRKGDYDRAIADEDAVIAIVYTMPSALYIRGLAKMKSGDTVGGKADVDAAIAVQKDVAQQYAKFGVVP